MKYAFRFFGKACWYLGCLTVIIGLLSVPVVIMVGVSNPTIDQETLTLIPFLIMLSGACVMGANIIIDFATKEEEDDTYGY